MKKTLIIFCLLLLLAQIKTHKGHKCIHDKDESIKKQYEIVDEYLKQLPKNRILQQAQQVDSQPIRITVDWSQINNNPQAQVTPQQLQYMQDQMEAAKTFFSKLLKVNQTKGNNLYPTRWYDQCSKVQVPKIVLDNGVANSDLHLFVIVKNVKEDYDLANAVLCSIDEIYQRPNYGRIEFNLAFFGQKTDSESFENDLETTIHETLHVLGFSGVNMKYWIDPQTGWTYGDQGLNKIRKQVEYRGKISNILFSKNVIEVARKYYGCDTMEGMQMENEGQGGSFGSHWEQLLVQNEMMMGSDISTDAALSALTIALLRDTGFYTEVNENMADNLYWGKGKGCEFVEKGCYSSQQFPEFPVNIKETQCSFENDGYGKPRQPQFMDKCYMKSIDKNQLCTSEANKKSEAEGKLEVYGINSKCFSSTASKGTKQYSNSTRCHQFKCSDDYKIISVIIPQLNKTLTCQNPNDIIQIDDSDSKKGSITCPSNFEQFCDYQPLCPNYCGGHGVCVRGTCFCNSGWAGVDCSQKCNYLFEDGNCVRNCKRGNYENPNNSCQPTCPKGYYQAKQRKCLPCNLSCKECANSPDNCTVCQIMGTLNGNKCEYNTQVDGASRKLRRD